MDYGIPDEIDRLATVVRGLADEALAKGSTHRAKADGVLAVTWVSTAADECRSDIHDDYRRLENAAHDLRAAADLLAKHADAVRAAQARIREVQESVEGWFEDLGTQAKAGVVGAKDRLESAASSLVLPPSGDPTWLEHAPFTGSLG